MIAESKSGKRFLIDMEDAIEMKAESAEVAEEWVKQVSAPTSVAAAQCFPASFRALLPRLASSSTTAAFILPPRIWKKGGGENVSESLFHYGQNDFPKSVKKTGIRAG